jgi:catechol 2,3-dioxygenase-like lactoylglutathione lyase family enzyme
VKILGLDHVQLAAPAGCEDEARRFYGDHLGLAEIEKPEPLRGRGGVWFSLGEQQLHIGVEPDFVPASKAHPALRVRPNELEELATRLSSADVEVVWDKFVSGVRRFYVQDPWGNRLELISRI